MLTAILTVTWARCLRTTGLLLVLLGLYACAATPGSTPDEGDSSAGEVADTVDNKDSKTDAAKSEDPTEVAFVPPESDTKKPAAQPAETKAVRIDVSCKNEPFSKYEKASRDSIAKGLSATTAEVYGVGFRDLEEHKRWSDTHGQLFTAVNHACSELSKCASKHPKDKTKQCAQQAEHFAQWQQLAKEFAEKAKQSETTQPPKICSFTPNLDDAASCFHRLADNVDKACSSSDCKETSECWRGVGYLDYAINQAASACRFAHEELSECRGYTTAKKRRKEKFARCLEMQKGLKATIIPVL